MTADDEAQRPLFEREIRAALGIETDFSRDEMGNYIDSSIDERWNGWMMKAHVDEGAGSQ